MKLKIEYMTEKEPELFKELNINDVFCDKANQINKEVYVKMGEINLATGDIRNSYSLTDNELFYWHPEATIKLVKANLTVIELDK
jgi:hypothetical protein